jgi:hypothetical protein
MAFGPCWRVTSLLSQAALLLVASVIATPRLDRKAESDATSLQLVLTQEPETLIFTAHWQNSGSKALVLNLGIMLANGREQYPDSLRLKLTLPEENVLHLQMIGPGVIGGRIDPMVVPLPPGATYSVRFSLNQYNAPEEKIWKLNLRSGSYSLTANYTGVAVPLQAANLDMKGISLMPYWTGTVQSDVLKFTIE